MKEDTQLKKNYKQMLDFLEALWIADNGVQFLRENTERLGKILDDANAALAEDEKSELSLEAAQKRSESTSSNSLLSKMDSRREEVSRDISHWRDNENFFQWIAVINNISYEQARALAAERFLGGWCEYFALYFAVRFEVPMLLLNQEHNIVNVAGLFFDAADCAGVEKLSDMKYVRESLELSRLSEEKLEKLLVMDENWRKYILHNPLASKVSLIEKYKQ